MIRIPEITLSASSDKSDMEAVHYQHHITNLKSNLQLSLSILEKQIQKIPFEFSLELSIPIISLPVLLSFSKKKVKFFTSSS